MWAVAAMDKWQYVIWCCWDTCNTFHACRWGKTKFSCRFAVPFWALSMSGIVISLVNKSLQYQGSSAELLSCGQNLETFPWLQQLSSGCHSSKTWPQSAWKEMVIQALCCGNTTFPLGMVQCLGTGRITEAHGLRVPVALGPPLNFLHQSPSILPLIQPNLGSKTAPFLFFPPLSHCSPAHTCTFPFP